MQGVRNLMREYLKLVWAIVFNYKLGCFGYVHVLNYVDAHPHLKLKTRPRFSPVSLILSMTDVTITVSGK